MTHTTGTRRRAVAAWAVGVTLFSELIAVAARLITGAAAADLGPEVPVLLRMHHMFWSVPVFAAAVLVRRRPRLAGALVGIGVGLVASDLVHHFVVLPAIVGNTGWHWP